MFLGAIYRFWNYELDKTNSLSIAIWECFLDNPTKLDCEFFLKWNSTKDVLATSLSSGENIMDVTASPERSEAAQIVFRAFLG